MPREMQEMLGHLQALVSHRIPSGDIVEVLCHALRIAVAHEEKQKFGITTRPRKTSRHSHDPRHIPSSVRRAVCERDQGQCTFVSDGGKRCPARRMLEFDHAVEVGRGGEPTLENIRLRCRAHNQYTAEQTFGAKFMEKKREEAQRAAAEKQTEKTIPITEHTEQPDDADVTPWLRALGYPADRVRHAIAKCGGMPQCATLEERVKAALRYLLPPHRHVNHVGASG
jgi:5-methylcytosine-specific restriction endonuclease McrA